MRDHLAITISDLSGSRHYTLKKSIKRHLVMALLLVLSVVSVSIGYNYWQHQQSQTLYGQNDRLDQEMARLNGHNSMLSERIATHNQLVAAIQQEVGEIERLGGVETSEEQVALAQRIRVIGRFYNEKEEEYSEIGERIEEIEGMIGLQENVPPGVRNDLTARVDLAALSARQENILHNSIPNGFPTEQRKITSKFGNRLHPVTKVKSFHRGVDLRAKTGADIHATASGIVREANYSKLSGNRVIIQHNFGFESYYAHLNKMRVQSGDIIHKGQLVGTSGNSGHSTAPHLHYEIRYLGKPVDPSSFLQWELGSHEIFTQVKGVKWPSLINLINQQITQQTLQLSQLDPVSPESSR